MKSRPVLTTLLLVAVTLATPCVAQQAPASALPLPIEPCTDCFAYLVFPPAPELNEPATSSGLAGDSNDGLKQSDSALVASKQ
jgi:hypothetical protein